MSLARSSIQSRRELDRKFKTINIEAIRQRPKAGWIKAVRVGLGMSLNVVAKRLGVTASAISQLERSEVDDGITIGKLKQIAQTMECDFVYALVPRDSLTDTVDRRARLVAAKHLGYVNQTMRLEDQGVDGDQQSRRINEYAADLIKKGRLWDESE